MDKGDPFDLSFLSPELTFQAKPFKNIPGIFSATAGARLNYEGGKQREGVPLTPNFYGNVRYMGSIWHMCYRSDVKRSYLLPGNNA